MVWAAVSVGGASLAVVGSGVSATWGAAAVAVVVASVWGAAAAVVVVGSVPLLVVF